MSAFLRTAASARVHTLFPAVLIGTGLILLGIVGFGQGTMLHELVHDGRHILAFPCH